MRTLTSLLLAVLSALACAQFKVDPQKIPVLTSKKRALVIGVANYEHLGKLSYSVSDAERFRDTLIKGFDFSANTIQFVTDAPESNVKPAAEAILHDLDSLLNDPTIDKGDLFIVFFSGHGMATNSGDYLCMPGSTVGDIEKTGLSVNKVIKKLVDAKLRNVIFIADACRAGEKNEFGTELYDLAKKSNVALLLGCEPGHKSYEVPQFRSGAFTYFLIKALSNPKNRTVSGGLWTSRIAQSLESSVFEYTEHDYGVNAQRPKCFADPTSDVMLAKFVPVTPGGAANVKDEDLEQVRDPLKNSDIMRANAMELLHKQDYAGSLDACKEALALNPQNYDAAYIATLSAPLLGRSGETEKFCEILKSSSTPYFKNLGFVQSDSRATPIQDRIKSLEAFWDSSVKDEITAITVWSKARIFCPMMVVKVLTQKMLPSMSGASRVKPFFEGEIAIAEGRLEDALAKYQAASKLTESSNYITDENLVVAKFPILRQLRRDDELKALMRAQFTSEKVSQTIWISVASTLKDMGNRDAAIAIVKKGIKEPNLTEQTIVFSGMIMGSAIGEIADELDAAQKASPYSWKVRTIALIAHAMKAHDGSTEEAFKQASRYCDDELEIISLTCEIEESIFRDLEKYSNVPAEKFIDQREVFRQLFFNRIDLLGVDSWKWFQLSELGMEMLQGPYTFRLMKQYLKDFNASSQLGSEFYTVLFRLAASVESDDVVKFAVNHPALTEPDRSDFKILYCVYLISRGDYTRAKNEYSPDLKISQGNEVIRQCLEAIFRARAGDPSALIHFLDRKFRDIESELTAEGTAALALCDLGKSDLAMPHLEVVTNHQSTMVGSIPMRCIERYLKLLKAKGKVVEADEILFAILKVNQMTPGIDASYFGAKPGIENFVCQFSVETKWVTDETFSAENPTHKDAFQLAAIGQGKIQLIVTKDGTAHGTIQVLDGESFALSGTVDQFGNLHGKAKSKLHEYDVDAKLVGNDFKKTETFKKSNLGQLIRVFGAKGLVTVWMIPGSMLSP